MANVKITALEHLSSTQAAPEDVSRQERVGFTNWMFQQLGGGASNA
jgi:hypothetical protein